MLTKSKKITKKEIKEDTLVTTYYKAIKFIDDYKSKIAIYAGVFILVAAAVAFYLTQKSKNNEKAGYELSKVLSLYEAGAYQEAIDGRTAGGVMGLKKIVDEYGSTENGETAKIFLANSYNLLGKFDQAFEYYDDYSGDIEMYKATALAGKGSYYEAKNEFDKAASSFEDAAYISKANALNGEYLLEAGINYMKAGKNSEAKEVFNKIKDEYKTSAAFREVDRYMAVLEAE